MEDDLDDLLDEIERDLASPKPQSKKAYNKSLNNMNDDVDDILNDNSDSDCTFSEPVKKRNAAAKRIPGTLKCNSLYVGGSKTPSGLSSATCKKSCDRLRCTSCDFKVEQFNDFEWTDSVDYLFLRNNMPDFRKVSSKLRRSKGCRAYACQCSWESAKVLNSLQRSNVKWVCGKHSE